MNNKNERYNEIKKRMKRYEKQKASKIKEEKEKENPKSKKNKKNETKVKVNQKIKLNINIPSQGNKSNDNMLLTSLLEQLKKKEPTKPENIFKIPEPKKSENIQTQTYNPKENIQTQTYNPLENIQTQTYNPLENVYTQTRNPKENMRTQTEPIETQTEPIQTPTPQFKNIEENIQPKKYNETYNPFEDVYNVYTPPLKPTKPIEPEYDYEKEMKDINDRLKRQLENIKPPDDIPSKFSEKVVAPPIYEELKEDLQNPIINKKPDTSNLSFIEQLQEKQMNEATLAQLEEDLRIRREENIKKSKGRPQQNEEQVSVGNRIYDTNLQNAFNVLVGISEPADRPNLQNELLSGVMDENRIKQLLRARGMEQTKINSLFSRKKIVIT